ncbi:MAG TPA: hypothetical protein VN924_05595 [Bryobacteraceae bacterium]|nr:hypothetical protein [Bryobacteraceae bacterium]
MTKVRALLLTALALVLACGIFSPQALAQDLAGDAQTTAIATGHVTDAAPDATSPGMYQGIVGMGPNPPAKGDWPCFGGSTDCSGVAKYGLVIGEPEQVWSKSCSGCGQIYYTFETTTATGTAAFTVTVTQGSTTIFKYSGSTSVSNNVIEVISVGPVTFTGGVAGAATISVSTTIGTATIQGGAKIVLH